MASLLQCFSLLYVPLSLQPKVHTRESFELVGEPPDDTFQSVESAVAALARSIIEIQPPPPPRKKSPDDKILVVVIGNHQGGNPASDSLVNNLIRPNRADLAIVVGRGTPRSPVLMNLSKYIWEHEEYGDDWSAALDSVGGSGKEWRSLALANRGTALLAPTPEDPIGSGAIVFYVKDFARRRIQHLNLTAVYSRFVITRADHLYACPLDLSALDSAKIWIPYGEDHGGVCDRFVITNSSVLPTVLNIIGPLMHRRFHEFRGNCERLLKRNLEDHGLWQDVSRFNRVMFLGSTQPEGGRWSSGGKRLQCDVAIKYSKEYTAAIRTCALAGYHDVGFSLKPRPALEYLRWKKHAAAFSPDTPGKVRFLTSLEEAKAACADTGPSACRAITCQDDTGRLCRLSQTGATDLKHSAIGEVSYTLDHSDNHTAKWLALHGTAEAWA